MARPFVAWRGGVLAVTVVLGACGTQANALDQHREKLESLGATTASIAEAWLGGSTSGTYTRTALEQTYQLVEQQRTALASKPDALADPRGAQLSEAAERLSRQLAVMIRDVEREDAAAMRLHATTIPLVPQP